MTGLEDVVTREADELFMVGSMAFDPEFFDAHGPWTGRFSSLACMGRRLREATIRRIAIFASLFATLTKEV